MNTPISTHRLAVICLPGASQMALGALLDCFSEINGALEETAFVPIQPVIFSDQQTLAAARPLLEVVAWLKSDHPPHSIAVLAGAPIPEQNHAEIVDSLKAWEQSTRSQRFVSRHHSLQAQANPETLLIGIGTGSFMLARAGLLAGRRAAIHWPFIALLAERVATMAPHSHTVISNQLYEIDNNCLTCANGIVVPELLCAWLAKSSGELADVAAELGEQWGIERAVWQDRGQSPSQRIPLTTRIGGGQPKLTEAVSLMEANIQEPLPAEEIARLVGISRRQLERLFKQYLDSLPSRYYLEMRLSRARHLLQHTSMSILQVGLACGFSSGPHFSSAYRARYDITPREQRAKPRAVTDKPSG